MPWHLIENGRLRVAVRVLTFPVFVVCDFVAYLLECVVFYVRAIPGALRDLAHELREDWAE